MQNLVPIQITFQAANAADIKTLVHDLAGTLGGMPSASIPAETTVSTVQPQGAPYTPQANTQTPEPPAAQQPNYGQQYVQQPQYGQVPTQQPDPTQYGQQPQQGKQAPTGAVPTSAPTYTLDQLGVAAQPVMDAGRGSDLIGWLQQHGAGALTQLDPKFYGEFATFLRSLGGRI